MKLKKFITESDDRLKESIDIINDQCQPYLRDLRAVKIKKLMYSGRRYTVDHGIKNVRTDRRPSDTDIKTHNLMDDLFFEKFGFRARSNAVFTTGDATTASQYGTIFSIWPIGGYKFIYSPAVPDLYMHLQKPSAWSPKGILKNIQKLFASDDQDMTNKLKILVDTYKHDSIHNAIKSNSEIMINCEKYLAVNHKYTYRLIDFVNRENQ